MTEAAAAPLKVSVRTLCEFAARRGDIDHRYTPSPSADEGIAGHGEIQARRPLSYQKEVPLSGSCEGLLVSGRADGYDPVVGRLEEIKTHRGDLSRMSPAQRALHRAQLRTYGALVCRSENLTRIRLTLLYYDISRDRETPVEETASAEELWQELTVLCRAYLDWARQEARHRAYRNSALAELVFPFDDFRAGQRSLAEAVYVNACRGNSLLLQAPTGLGKTLGTLFPALMAVATAGHDRLFYLTARNTGRRLALDALTQLAAAQPGRLPLRVLELSAKTDACEHPDKACHGEACPLARGFFDRLPKARQAAVNQAGPLTADTLREVALAYDICPYFLAQEMARWSDVVVADVNRMFDQSAILHGLTRQNDWKVSVLIDEAHNLIDRARGMYSVTLSQKRLLSLRRTAPSDLKAPLNRMARAWQGLLRDRTADVPAILSAIPASFTGALNGLASAITDYLTEQPPDYELQELMFESLAFARLAEVFGEHSLCELTLRRRGQATLSIQNLIPADFLRPRFASLASTLLFSATLSPGIYHRDLLGLPEDTRWKEVSSPFSHRQLQVRFVGDVSTRQGDRERSLMPIARLIASEYQRCPGNYLAYFSSFTYADAVRGVLEQHFPDVPVRYQSPGMSVGDREAFVAGFSEGGRSVAFAVLGGVFGEGIDLPGDRLIGAFVATLGLPPFDHWHQVLRSRLDARFGAGYDYAYLYPGIQKVVQAAGRVIRTEQDQGRIWLIDDRFGRRAVRNLLPAWWFAPADSAAAD